ncbi:MAG TPA: CBO0543 family protein [Selenomonadales bacterium]|nr:CBO0543 family protein [Selenomonadales bacterium]
MTDSAMAVTVELQRLLTRMRVEEWLQGGVFNFRWWLLLALFFVSAFVWYRLVDKRRLPEMVLYVGLTTIITLVLDEFGEELVLWDYPTDILPIFPPLTAVDLASLPMIYSLIYQYFGTWRSFTWATVIMATVFCFVLEPVLVWGGFYQLLKWRYYYGFPIYIALALFIRWMVVTIYALAEKAEEKG